MWQTCCITVDVPDGSNNMARSFTFCVFLHLCLNQNMLIVGLGFDLRF